MREATIINILRKLYAQAPARDDDEATYGRGRVRERSVLIGVMNEVADALGVNRQGFLETCGVTARQCGLCDFPFTEEAHEFVCPRCNGECAGVTIADTRNGK